VLHRRLLIGATWCPDGEEWVSCAADSVDHGLSKGKAMAKATVEVLVDDLDGSEGAETIRLGWNGEWRELELSKRNLASLSRALDKYWNAARPVSADGQSGRRRRPTATTSRSTKARRDPKLIRVWAT
jgi:nucleoid-associated protein Lsr2